TTVSRRLCKRPPRTRGRRRATALTSLSPWSAAGSARETAGADASNAVTGGLGGFGPSGVAPPVVLGDDRQVRPFYVRGAVPEQAVTAGAAQAAAAEVDPRIGDAADARRLGLERGPRLAIARYV